MSYRHILLGVAIILVLVGTVKLYERYHRPLTHQLSADLQWLGLIDLDNTHEITLHAVEEGEDGVLVVDHALQLYHALSQKIPKASLLTPDEALSINNLHLFDSNNDGKITEDDPLFAHLYLIKFSNKGEDHDIVSLSSVGIKAILLNNTTPTGDHVVIMNDGSTRKLIGPNKIEKTKEE